MYKIASKLGYHGMSRYVFFLLRPKIPLPVFFFSAFFFALSASFDETPRPTVGAGAESGSSGL
jgi:hypothetical protein